MNKLYVAAALAGLASVSILTSGCKSDTKPTSVTDVEPAALTQPVGAATERELQVAVLKARQSEADELYSIIPAQGAGTAWRSPPELEDGRTVHFQSANPARQNIAEYTDHGVRLARQGSTTVNDESRVELRLERWGRSPESPDELNEASTSVQPRIASSGSVKNRIEYEHEKELTEWFLNGPLGLEHGFTLSAPPEGEGELVFDILLEGAGVTPRLVDGDVELQTGPGVSIGHYGDLYAEDASGRLLNAELSLVDGFVRLSVDDANARYPLVVDPLAWLAEAKLFGSISDGGADSASGDSFGWSVAIDGDLMAVGVTGADEPFSGSGAVYVYAKVEGQWVPEAKLVALTSGGLDDADFYSSFGTSVAVSGDVVVVGANYAEVGDAGAVYVYARANGAWPIAAKVRAQLPGGAADGSADDHFGESVSFDGETLVVGAPDADATGVDSGAVYVYSKQSYFVPVAKLPGSEAGLGDHFGRSVSVSGDLLVVGAPQEFYGGQAHVYARSGETWSFSATLLPQLADGTADQASGDGFGTSVGVDGNTILVGSPGDDERDTGSGSAYVYTNIEGAWTIRQKLIATTADGTLDGGFNAGFGREMSLHGDTVLIGAPGDDERGGSSGSGYVFARTNGEWVPEGKLLAMDGGMLEGVFGDTFGGAVGLSGDTVVLGAYGVDGVGANSGAVYVMDRKGEAWMATQKVVAESPPVVVLDRNNAYFGRAVAVDGDTAVVGALDDWDGTTDAGSAYVFSRTGTRWLVQQKILSPNAESDGKFGQSVSLDGDTVAIGAPLEDGAGADWGTVHVFTRSGDSWGLQESLQAMTTAGAADGATGDQFGAKLSLDGDTLAVGARRDDDLGTSSGAAYIFVRSAGDWSIEQKLVPDDGVAGDIFGGDLSLSGNTVLVGALGVSEQGADAGAAYAYRRSGSTWTLEEKLQAQLPDGALDGAAGDWFGQSVSLDGDTALIGATYHDGAASNSGAMYVFERTGGDWAIHSKLGPQAPVSTSSNFGQEVSLSGNFAFGWRTSGVEVYERIGATWAFDRELVSQNRQGEVESVSPSRFGVAIDADGDTVIVGDDYDQDASSYSGAAFVFKATDGEPGGAACYNDAGCADGPCLDGICCEAACDGTCNSCASTVTGGTDGSCEPLAGGTRCSEDPLSCASKDAYRLASRCDGAGACVEQSAECSGGYACLDVEGGGSGGCINTCVDHDGCGNSFWCEAGECLEDRVVGEDCSFDEQCLSGACPSGSCLGSLSEECVNDAECESGHCADGVCCSESCGNQCEACNADGQCEAIEGEPVGGRPACDGGEHESCAATCDGRVRDGCVYPDQGTECEAASCSDSDVLTVARVCDGAGACTTSGAPTEACAPYACESASCLGGCTSDDECAAGHTCDVDNGECVESGYTCLDSLTIVAPDGEETDCTPYLCAAGACRETCSTSNDCARGFECDGGSCVADEGVAGDAADEESDSSDTDQSGGCSCTTGGPKGGGNVPWGLFLVGLGVVVARRRALVA